MGRKKPVPIKYRSLTLAEFKELVTWLGGTIVRGTVEEHPIAYGKLVTSARVSWGRHIEIASYQDTVAYPSINRGPEWRRVETMHGTPKDAAENFEHAVVFELWANQWWSRHPKREEPK